MDPVPILETTLVVAALVGAVAVCLVVGGLVIAAAGGGIQSPDTLTWPDVIARSEATRARMRDRYLARWNPRPPATQPEPFVPEPPKKARRRAQPRPHRRAA